MINSGPSPRNGSANITLPPTGELTTWSTPVAMVSRLGPDATTWPAIGQTGPPGWPLVEPACRPGPRRRRRDQPQQPAIQPQVGAAWRACDRLARAAAGGQWTPPGSPRRRSDPAGDRNRPRSARGPEGQCRRCCALLTRQECNLAAQGIQAGAGRDRGLRQSGQDQSTAGVAPGRCVQRDEARRQLPPPQRQRLGGFRLPVGQPQPRPQAVQPPSAGVGCGKPVASGAA